MSLEAAEALQFFLQRQHSVTTRHSSGDRIIAIIEIVFRSNRHSRDTLNDFAEKIIAMLDQKIHVVIIDPFPGSQHDSHGIHGLIWEKRVCRRAGNA